MQGGDQQIMCRSRTLTGSPMGFGIALVALCQNDARWKELPGGVRRICRWARRGVNARTPPYGSFRRAQHGVAGHFGGAFGRGTVGVRRPPPIHPLLRLDRAEIRAAGSVAPRACGLRRVVGEAGRWFLEWPPHLVAMMPMSGVADPLDRRPIVVLPVATGFGRRPGRTSCATGSGALECPGLGRWPQQTPWRASSGCTSTRLTPKVSRWSVWRWICPSAMTGFPWRSCGRWLCHPRCLGPCSPAMGG